MNSIEFLELLKILGVSSLLPAVLGWLGKRYLDKTIEQEKSVYQSDIKRLENTLNNNSEVHKQKLKNSEVFFQCQFEASQALYKLKRSMLPPYRCPDMEWDEAVEEMAGNLRVTHAALQAFLVEYFTVLPPEILEKLESATANAEEGKLYGGGGWGSPGNQCADAVYKKLEKCTSLMKAEVDGQRLVEFHETTRKNHDKGKGVK